MGGRKGLKRRGREGEKKEEGEGEEKDGERERRVGMRYYVERQYQGSKKKKEIKMATYQHNTLV